MANQNKENNKSLFLYTALIFFVAIILIILAFFGQTNYNKNNLTSNIVESTATPQTQENGIPEKAAALNAENAALVKEIQSLNEEIEQKDKTITDLQLQIEGITAAQNNSDLLFQAYTAKINQNEDDVTLILSNINYEQLTQQQKAVYDSLNK